MRDVIEKYPVSPQVYQAYYYIGLGHFQQGHYSRAIAALEKVGTALSADDAKVEKVEAGKRLFVRIEDADLAALDVGKTVKVTVETAGGDKEIVECHPVGRNVRVVLGKSVNLQVVDADFDLTDKADILKAVVEVYREKTAEELKAEPPAPDDKKSDPHKLDRFRKIDSVEVILTEAKQANPAGEEK